MAGEAPLCRLCGSGQVGDLGPIPDNDYFAGCVLSSAIPGGRLWLCAACGSMFKHPVMPAVQYRLLYESGTATQWHGGEHRQDLRTVREIIAAQPRVTGVLDVGCGTGDFLSSLPPGLAKFGIEPSAAAVKAAARGIQMLAPAIEQLAPQAQFDVITIIDVIEHVADPNLLLDAAYAHLLPGGCLVIATGDPGCAIWQRLLRSRFWYASFPEHLTFPSRGFFDIWGRRNAVQSLEKVALRYQRLSLWRFALGLMIQAAYALSPPAFHWLGRLIDRVRGAPERRRQYFSPGIPGVFVDHQVVTAWKRKSA
jgi:SAM-dependent methyltransferase